VRRRSTRACCWECRRSGLPDIAALADTIDAGLRAAGTPDRAANEKRYLKSDLDFYGVTVPAMRRVTRDAAQRQTLEHDDVVALAELLWSVPVHERRMAAVDVLELRTAVLGGADLSLVERLVRQSRTWALVDGLAISVAGTIVVREPAAAQALDRWVTDSDFWVRRAALLALIAGVRAGSPDLARIERFSDTLLEDKELFIRKATGWLLREVARKDPAWVAGFLRPRVARVSGLTLREAAKPLPAELRAGLFVTQST
jgi:3-methyladenine DNA glycosylase AlkD